MNLIGGSLDDWGFLPGFLDENDPRPAREQFHEKQPGGWHKAPPKVSFNPDTGRLEYPGDPPLSPISFLLFRDEIIALYPGAWVVIIQPDASWEAARMD